MSEHEIDRIKVVIVSGLSGAGKTVALRALEDSGFFCIDNLPVTLIESFLSAMESRTDINNIGIGVDIREKTFLGEAYRIISELKHRYLIQILFLESEKDVMIRRFKETRRPHPMITSGAVTSIEAAIDEEKKQLAVLRESADRIVDTSNYSPHQLRQLITTSYGTAESTQKLNIVFISFGYKFGVPQNADLLFDVRFLPNPYFVPSLRPLTGLDKDVASYVLACKETSELISRLNDLLDFLIPHYMKEGRSYLVVGVGCTGGMHRSPVIVQELAKKVQLSFGIEPAIIHRDINQ